MHNCIFNFRKFAFAACSISSLVFCQFSVNALEHEIQTLLSYQEWQQLKELPSCSHEILILRDGTKLCGTIQNVPPMDYSFGRVEFKLNDIVAIAFSSSNKIQYITRDGQNFIGTLASKKPLLFIENETKKNHQVDPENVRLIVFRNHHMTTPAQSRIYSLQLKNGDHLPVYIESDRILVSNGWREYSIDPQHIAEIHFNGGAYGYLAVGDDITKLNFSFIKDKYLEVHFPQNAQSLKFPWGQVSSLQKGTGGFILEFLDESKTRDMGKHVIGYTPNDLLDGVSGGVVVPSEVFSTLDQEKFDTTLSHDPELVALFSKEGQFDEEEEIAFSEDPIAPKILKDEDFETYSEIVFEDLHLDRIPLEPKEEFEIAMEEFDYHEFKEEEEEEEAHPAGSSFQFSSSDTAQPTELIADSGDMPIIDLLGQRRKERPSPLSNNPENSRMIYVSSDTISLGDLTPSKNAFAKKYQLEKTLLPTKESPTLIVRTPGFFIDLNLVTNAEYQKFVQETDHPYPEHWGDQQIPPDQEHAPVVNISYKDAHAYAVWKGKRLPTEMERTRALDKNLIANDNQAPYTEWTSSNTDQKQISCPLQLCRSRIMQLHQNNSHTSFRCAADVPISTAEQYKY